MTDHGLYDDGRGSKGKTMKSRGWDFPMKYPGVVYVRVYCILQRPARLTMYSNRGRKDFSHLAHPVDPPSRYFAQCSRNGLQRSNDRLLLAGRSRP